MKLEYYVVQVIRASCLCLHSFKAVF